MKLAEKIISKLDEGKWSFVPTDLYDVLSHTMSKIDPDLNYKKFEKEAEKLAKKYNIPWDAKEAKEMVNTMLEEDFNEGSGKTITYQREKINLPSNDVEIFNHISKEAKKAGLSWEDLFDYYIEDDLNDPEEVVDMALLSLEDDEKLKSVIKELKNK